MRYLQDMPSLPPWAPATDIRVLAEVAYLISCDRLPQARRALHRHMGDGLGAAAMWHKAYVLAKGGKHA